MSDQIILAWTVPVAGSSFGPAQAAAALAAVPLYANATTDPVLGQLFGLTVANDATTNDLTSATRTLTLNMTSGASSPLAPPPFPCHPITATPPALPYPFRSTKTLPGSFFVELGSSTVVTSTTQIPSLNPGDVIQFLNQPGVFYTILAVPDTVSITLTTPFTGTSGNTGAFKEIAAPANQSRVAMYSTSDLDTNGVVVTVPVIPAGSGAQIVQFEFMDSTGGGPFAAQVLLTGRRPALITIIDPGSVDVAVITAMAVVAVGSFGNSVGQLTLVELSDDLPALPPNLPIGTGIGATEAIARTFKTMTDEAQLLIARALVYMPPSYFALAQQQASAPALEGDFLVTTGSTEVPTTVDQSGVLSGGDVIEFADQEGTRYTVSSVTPKIVKLTTIYTGIDTNNTGLANTPNNNNAQTKGNIGDAVQKKSTGARLIDPSPAAPPTSAELSGPLGQFVAPETASPPPSPPLSPATVPVPTFLSDLFTQTLQLALAGVPISPATITFA